MSLDTKLAILKNIRDDRNVTITCVPYTIGRCKSANFIIAHVNVSRNHCRIYRDSESWKICDFSSSGTYVNNILVGKEKWVALRNGDLVRFGPAESKLSWHFYTLNSPQVNIKNECGHANSQVLLNFQNNSPNKVVYLNSELKKNNLNEENHKFLISKTFELPQLITSKIQSKEPNQSRSEVEDNDIAENLSSTEKLPSVSKYEIDKEKSKSEKIQELTKELQQIQCALNDLEKKKCPQQGDWTAGTKIKTETPNTSNIVENLTDVMESEFQCTICSELFVTAVTLGCTHTFCKYCINQWKQKQKTCPICRKKITSETKSLVLDNYIDKMIGNLSLELKHRREEIIKERNEAAPLKKRTKIKSK